MTTALPPRSAGASRVVVAAPISEQQFQAQVLELARLLGWRSAHFRPAQTVRGWRTPVSGDGAGFPDTVLVRRDRLVAAELKSAKGRPSPEQLVWLEALAAAGVECFLWRPDQLEEIADVLR